MLLLPLSALPVLQPPPALLQAPWLLLLLPLPLLVLLLLPILFALQLPQNYLCRNNKLYEKRIFSRGRLAHPSVIAVWDIIYPLSRLSYAICDRIFLRDNLTREVSEKGDEGTLNGELLFQNRTLPLSREMRICGETPRHS
jgi:hypothetical protein